MAMRSSDGVTPPTRIKSHVLDREGIRRVLTRMAHQILEQHGGGEKICLIGIRSRGEVLARRLRDLVRELQGVTLEVGALDITLYRDDLSLIAPNPVVHATEISFDVTGYKVIIVDDVLFTGRTVRAAMDALADFGRPQSIELMVLIDRGHRELPIKADFVGKNLPTGRKELVQVRLVEMDGLDEVVIEEKAE